MGKNTSLQTSSSMKSATKQVNALNEPLGTFPTMTPLSSSLSATTSKKSMTHLMPLKSHSLDLKPTKKAEHQVVLSKSMEKIFRKMKKDKEVREAYVEAEIVSSLAHQIRAMRIDRKLSQADLAKKMKTTQAAISRLEDPSYGQLSLQTLFKLSHAFDTGLRVEFVSTLNMLNSTFKPKESARHVASFEEEVDNVVFYSPMQTRESASTQTVNAKTISVGHTAMLAPTLVQQVVDNEHQPIFKINTEVKIDELQNSSYIKYKETSSTF